jgi:hypothetical protein
MLGIVENFIRRIEKIISSSPTVPPPGTNHVDDIWLSTDLYPGELAINFDTGGLYTSDGVRIINLNTENVLISGMIVSKDTSGVNKLTVSSGSVRIKGVEYFHTSSGTDILLPINATTDPELYFIYAQSAAGSTSSLLVVTSINSTYNDIYYDVTSSENIPYPPVDSVLLGTVLVPVGATGYLLQPLSIASLGDYYPKFSLTPSEYLRTLTSINSLYETSHLYFPGQIIVDYTSNTEYLAKTTFISDYTSIAGDISIGNVIALGGSGGGGGGGTYTATNIGTGTANVFDSEVANQFRFRSIKAGSNLVVVGYTGPSTISIDIDPSKFVLGITNSGTGSQIYKGITSSSLAQLRSLTAGSTRLTISTVGDNIVLDVPFIGTTAQGVNLGTVGATAYGGMVGANLGFKRFLGTSGIGITQDATNVYISTTAKNNNGVNIGTGAPIYYGMAGDNLALRSLTAGSNITITNIGNEIQISSSGGGGSITGATSIGASSGAIYAGPLGSELSFRSITPGYGIAVTRVGNNVQIDATIADGSQGVQGLQGPQGFRGVQGFQGFQGFQGASGTNGTNGLQGRQGPLGPQGVDGPVGPTGTPGLTTPVVQNNSIEIYDNGLGWTVTSGQQRLVTFDTIGASDPIYAVTQLSPVGSGTTVNSAVPGRYLIMYTITGTITDGVTAEFSLYDNTALAVFPGSTTRMLEEGGDVQLSVSAESIVDYSAGTEFGIMCTVSPVVPGSVTGVAFASSFSMIRLDGNKGETGPQGANSIIVDAPLTGDGGTASHTKLAYNTDFGLTSTNVTPSGAEGLMLNLEATTIVVPTISSSSVIYKIDGTTPFGPVTIGSVSVGGTMTSNNITVPNGCKVNYTGNANIPAPGGGQGAPTSVTGSFGYANPPSVFPAAGSTSVNGISAPTSFSVSLSKPKTGLITSGSSAPFQIVRATGTDNSNASASISFNSLFYWGYLQIGPVGNTASQPVADGLTAGQIEPFTKFNFGTKAQVFAVDDSLAAGRGPGWRLVFAYLNSAGSLLSLNAAGIPLDQKGAFLKKATSTTITTITGATASYAIYISGGDNSWVNTITTT